MAQTGETAASRVSLSEGTAPFREPQGCFLFFSPHSFVFWPLFCQSNSGAQCFRVSCLWKFVLISISIHILNHIHLLLNHREWLRLKNILFYIWKPDCHLISCSGLGISWNPCHMGRMAQNALMLEVEEWNSLPQARLRLLPRQGQLKGLAAHTHTTQKEHCCLSSMNVSCPIYMTGRGLQVSHTSPRGDSLLAALQPNPFILFSNTFPLGKVQKLCAVLQHMCVILCVLVRAAQIWSRLWRQLQDHLLTSTTVR